MTPNLPGIARRAAGLMAERGHAKYMREDAEGRVCFAGAVFLALTGNTSGLTPTRDQHLDAFDAWEKIRDTAGRILASRGEEPADASLARGVLKYAQESPAVNYNNRSDITGEDVILLLKETASELENQSP